MSKARELMQQGANLVTPKQKSSISKPIDNAKGYWKRVADKYKDKEHTDSEEDHYQHALNKIK